MNPTELQRRLRDQYGPWAVVTGASDGIGRAFAEALAEAGVHLVLVARRAAALEELAGQLVKRGVEARVLAADLGSDAGIRRVQDGTADLSVGLLVAAAGFGTSGNFLRGDLEEELAMIDVNCRAVAALSHHFGRRFEGQGRGGLVLLSSLLAFQGVPRAANYAATKAYVQTLAEGLRAELGPSGVKVLSVASGTFKSVFAARARMQMSMAGTASEVADGALRALGKRGTVRPGFLSKLLEWSLATLPRWGRTRILAKVMAGMTRHPT